MEQSASALRLYCPGRQAPQFLIGELGPGMKVNRKLPNLGPRLTSSTRASARAAGRRAGAGQEAGKFLAPHGLARRFARRHLRRRGRCHQLENEFPRYADAESRALHAKARQGELRRDAGQKGTSACTIVLVSK